MIQSNELPDQYKVIFSGAKDIEKCSEYIKRLSSNIDHLQLEEIDNINDLNSLIHSDNEKRKEKVSRSVFFIEEEKENESLNPRLLTLPQAISSLVSPR